MTAGGRNRQRAFRERLAAHVGEIGCARRGTETARARRRRVESAALALEVLHDLGQRRRDIHLGVRDERRFAGVRRRQHESATGLLRREHGGQRARDRPQVAVQRELAQELERADRHRAWRSAMSTPSAIGRSKRPPCFGMSAGPSGR